jgi:hypothetical protein
LLHLERCSQGILQVFPSCVSRHSTFIT